MAVFWERAILCDVVNLYMVATPNQAVCAESYEFCALLMRDIFSRSVTVSLKPAGNAPLLRQRKFLVERSRTVGWMIQWLKKTLKCEAEESVVSLVAWPVALLAGFQTMEGARKHCSLTPMEFKSENQLCPPEVTLKL